MIESIRTVFINNKIVFSIAAAIILLLFILILRIARKSKIKRTSTMYKNYISIKKNYKLKDSRTKNLFIYEISNSLLLQNLNIDEYIHSKLADKNTDLWHCFEDMQLNYYMNSRTNMYIRNLSPTDASIIKKQRMSIERYHSIERKLCVEFPNPNEKNTFEFILHSRKPKRLKKSFKLTFADLQEIESIYETEASKHYLEKQYNKWINSSL